MHFSFLVYFYNQVLSHLLAITTPLYVTCYIYILYCMTVSLFTSFCYEIHCLHLFTVNFCWPLFSTIGCSTNQYHPHHPPCSILIIHVIHTSTSYCTMLALCSPCKYSHLMVLNMSFSSQLHQNDVEIKLILSYQQKTHPEVLTSEAYGHLTQIDLTNI